jgi:hypothetical protein
VPSSSTSSPRHDRLEIASLFSELQDACSAGLSERHFCDSAPIARSTLRDEVARFQACDADPALVAFFFSPAGHLFLRRIVLAAHFAMTLLGPCGVPLVRTFLILAGLAPFVATSYGAQQSINVSLQDKIALFGREERERLAKKMPQKTIWLCEDETFFSRMILVAIEALSDFILVERYAENRDASTWNASVKSSLQGLPVEVAGITGDGARGICAHATQAFGVMLTPDLFHLQQDLCKSATAPLARCIRAIENKLNESKPEKDPGNSDRISDELADVREMHQRVSAAVHGLSEVDHPYDERTGEPRSGKLVREEWNEMLDEIAIVADEGGLPEASYSALKKARRATEAVGSIREWL